ncbi:MAG TPA: SET domain-containing protein-lysine N-methyltransferase [Niabella sp.]|jgi:hypothetical protein|nr:SET domain-containing protein-lysine N-methyltransferase [Chitinophagaceae bacterium]HRN46431.1 SET domain-containing protein-lysine N-methyltransferase [Niabella sp.]HRO84398.1 SET domain-containing protein-lysine N-methyltransferase [Niabella sp.]HUN02801.1 SET domain-containing protein-lysine N-methyltransferase [Niabella sp.]
MPLPSNDILKVKTSTLPKAGKGLFAKIDFSKGAIVAEYEGRLCKWKDVEDDVDNGYIYHINDSTVIDAAESVHTFGRYANDAAGFQKIEGVKNNAKYVEDGKRVYIMATKKIYAGNEVFVSYGRLYWKQVRENKKIDMERQRSKALPKK